MCFIRLFWCCAPVLSLLLPLQPCLFGAESVPKILFLTQSKGFAHPVVRRGEGERSAAELAMMQLAKDSGEFTIHCTQNAEADITRENLERYDVVAFYTTGDLPIHKEHLDYFLNDWLHQKGHGFMGFHSATDTFKNFEPYWDMIGGTFAGHPWSQNTKVSLTVHDPDHPTMTPFGKTFEYRDEIYQYNNWQPEKVHVLMSLDMEHTKTKRPYHVPVAWCKQVGEGKLYYNNLGHREDTWRNEQFLRSIVGGVRWIAGKEEGDASPNPDVSARQHAHSIQHANAAGTTLEALQAQKRAHEAQRKARQAAKAKKEAEKSKQAAAAKKDG